MCEMLVERTLASYCPMDSGRDVIVPPGGPEVLSGVALRKME